MGPAEIPVLFRKAAQELCGAFYEENRRSKEFRDHWKQLYEAQKQVGNRRYRASNIQDYYVSLNWPSWLPTAKDMLLAMLQMPNTEVPQYAKDEIYDTFTKNIEQLQAISLSGTKH